MASNDDARQPLINPFTSNNSSNVKYTDSSPSTTLAMASTPTSPNIENKQGFHSRFKQKLSSVALTFMSEMSHRLALRIKLHKRLKMVADVMCFFGLLGVILMVIENEITFDQINHRDTILTSLIKIIITITTVILIALVFLYHYLDLSLYSVNNSIDDWRIGLTNKRIFLIIVEIIICAIHPILHYPNVQIEESDVNSTTTVPRSYITMDVALGLPMFLRFYLLCRVILYHSRLVKDASSQSIGYLSRISIDFSFLIKTYLDQKPLYFLAVFFPLFFFISTWSFRACAYRIPEGHLSVLDSMWLFILSFATLGYADVIPTSYCERTIAVLTAFIGLLTSALSIAVLTQKLIFLRREKYVHHFVIKTELAKDRKIQSANVIKYAMKLWHLSKTHRSKSSIQYLLTKRKLLQTFDRIRQIKTAQRELVDGCVGLQEIATVQRETNTNSDDTVKKIVNMEVKMDRIEGQLMHVNQTIQNLQNTLDLLVDKMAK